MGSGAHGDLLQGATLKGEVIADVVDIANKGVPIEIGHLDGDASGVGERGEFLLAKLLAVLHIASAADHIQKSGPIEGQKIVAGEFGVDIENCGTHNQSFLLIMRIFGRRVSQYRNDTHNYIIPLFT